MKKKLKIGVISCSIMAQVHMQAVMDNPNTELAMLCDLNETLLHEAADKFGVEKTAVDYRDVLNDPEIDAVIIVTPDQTHKEITLAALAAKKHVLCEKPMALKLDECSEMIAAAKAAETKMMVGQICRYTPGFVEAKKLIDRGEITEEQAKLHPDRNKITRAIGAEEMVTPDYFELDLADGDMLLLCSDGLSSYGDDMDILDICFEYPTEDICDKLVDYANGNGGHDNISVALIAV